MNLNFTTSIQPVASIGRVEWSTLRIHNIAYRAAIWKDSHIVLADNYTKDTREWPDPTEPRAPTPPVPKGCTCPSGQKLECPVHGMNGTLDDFDNPWANQTQANPVGYPQDAPRNWDVHHGSQVCTTSAYHNDYRDSAPVAVELPNDNYPDHVKRFGDNDLR